MSFGSGGFGSVPFGTTFISLASAPEVSYVEFLGKDLIRIWYTEDIIINSDYRSSSSYSLLDSNGGILPIILIVPTSTAISLPYTLLRVRPQIEGQTYTVTVSRITDRSGTVISNTANSSSWEYNRTKGDSIIAAMPGMYDVSGGSNLRGILQAIANEDNLIGGSNSGVSDDD